MSAYDDVTAVLHELGRGMSANDADAVLALFSRSEDVVMFGSEEGETAHGQAALGRLWARVLARGQRYTWRWRDETVTGAGPVAWMSASATVTIDDADGTRELPYRLTLVLVHDEERWRIVQYHGSEPGRAW